MYEINIYKEILLLGNVFKDANVSGRNLLKVCNPVGFKGDTVQTKQTKRNANRKLAWIGAFVQYTPWMEYNGTRKNGFTSYFIFSHIFN